MPALFVGHGSPMNAIEDNAFSQRWAALGRRLPRPEAILCVSAHWLTEGTAVTAMERPRTIHDFYGFPDELYRVSYPAPGAPDLAWQVVEGIRGAQVQLDEEWGLDHGTWSVLRHMAPQADVPTIQLSLDHSLSPPDHYALARELRPLRERGILIVGSGNAVHNLQRMSSGAEPFEWATAFDEWVVDRLLAGDHRALTDYQDLFARGPQLAHLAHPTPDHYWPLLYAIAVQDEGEPLSFFCEQIVYGSISMRGVLIGGLVE
jgi:4,5-DOPA dioxygenase extradiol